jgi:hypothetical protein
MKALRSVLVPGKTALHSLRSTNFARAPVSS